MPTPPPEGGGVELSQQGCPQLMHLPIHWPEVPETWFPPQSRAVSIAVVPAWLIVILGSPVVHRGPAPSA